MDDIHFMRQYFVCKMLYLMCCKMSISALLPVFTFVLLFQVTTQDLPCPVLPPSVSEKFNFNRLAVHSWNISLKSKDLEMLSFSLCNITHESVCGNVSFCMIKSRAEFSSLHSQFEVSNNIIMLTAELYEKVSSHTIKVEVLFRCSDEDEKPQYYEESKGIIRLTWETIAACPIRNRKSFENCLYNINGMSHTINLQSARKKNYYNTTDSEGNTYFLNICGTEVGGMACRNISDGNVAACKLDANDTETILAQASKQQVIKDENGLVLELRNKSRSHVKIEIICNPRIPRGVMNFKTLLGDKQKDESKVFIFELETSLACVQEPVDCSVTDTEKQWKYSLSPLTSDVHKITFNNAEYSLSVCKPLRKKFSDGAFAQRCNGAECVNTGTLYGGPKIINGKLILSSLGGDKCNGTFRYRTEIEFICSKTEQPPVFEKSVDCVDKFLWHSKAACPSIFALGDNCKLFSEVINHSFDFQPLYKQGDYKIETDGVFLLNICGNLSKPCNGSKNVGVCFIDEAGREHAIGNTALRPRYEDGRLGFVLQGQCSWNTLSTVHIIFVCNQNVTLEESQPQFLGKDNCTFYFVWPTNITCGNFEEYNCKYSDDKGHIYDLSPLSSSYYNTIVLNGTKNFFINVCRSVVMGHDARCPSNTGICLEDVTEENLNNRFTSLGKPSELQYNKEKKVLFVEYRNRAICPGNGVVYFHSVITFICDRNATGETVPELIHSSTCYYEFQWKTKLACSEEEISAVEMNNCKIFDSFSGSQFDLTPLTNKKHSLKTPTGDTLHLAICGSLNETDKTGIGVCKEIDKGCKNFGLGNTNLYFLMGTIVLNYTDGENCTGGLRTYTTIEFLCDAHDSGPRIKSLSSCNVVITWYTNLVCVVPCVTEGSRKQVNISLLKNNERNYRTKFGGVDYFINVCRPLVPIPGLNCKHDSAVCRAVEKAENEWTDTVDLGIPHFRPLLIEKGVVLKYSSDSTCLHRTSQNVSSSLNFTCDPKAGKGNPVLHNFVDDCLYEFEWKTSVVCDDFEMKLDHTSWNFFISKENDLFVDLSSVCSDKIYSVQNFRISMCNNNSVSEVRKVEKNKQTLFGKSTSIIFSYSENTTKIFMSGEECKYQATERYSAVLNLMCSLKESHLFVSKENECSVEFIWETSAGCLQMESIKVEIAASHMSVAGFIVGILLVLFTLICLLCFRTPAHRNWCRRRVNLLFNRTHRAEYGYTLNNSEMDFLDLSSVESL